MGPTDPRCLGRQKCECYSAGYFEPLGKAARSMSAPSKVVRHSDGRRDVLSTPTVIDRPCHGHFEEASPILLGSRVGSPSCSMPWIPQSPRGRRLRHIERQLPRTAPMEHDPTVPYMRCDRRSASGSLSAHLRLLPPQRDREHPPRDSRAEGRRHFQRQTGVDRALGVVEKAPALIRVAFETRIGDPRLSEYRAVALRHKDERHPRAGYAERRSRKAGGELAAKVD